MKIAFVDRDGTLIYEPIVSKQIDSLDKLVLLPGVIAGLKRLMGEGYKLVMVTNQDGLGTASYPKKLFEIPQQKMLDLLKEEGINFAEVFICPHRAQDKCPCRKPKIGLVKNFVEKNKVDLGASIMIGDRPTDEGFAKNLGVRFIEMQSNGSFPRFAHIERNTQETQVKLELNLDGSGAADIQTPIGFLNHMLELFTKHGMFNLRVRATGDVDKDDHHVIEDVGIVLGQALAQAIGSKVGINRYGSQILPMDEVLCVSAVDLSGRYAFESNYKPVREKANDFPTEMMKHFFQSIAVNAMMNLHIQFLNPGENEHHRLEAVFKSFARALRQAVSYDTRGLNQLPSTKKFL